MKIDWYMTCNYEIYKKLIYRMAWSFSQKTGIEIEELISEFNVVFCEACNKYDSDKGVKFSLFFCRCCRNRIINLLLKMDRKKRKFVVYSDKPLHGLSYNPVESIIVYDNFVNSPDKVIRKIARIVSIYSLPRANVKPWLRKILLKSFSIKEVAEAFRQLSNLYEK